MIQHGEFHTYLDKDVWSSPANSKANIYHKSLFIQSFAVVLLHLSHVRFILQGLFDHYNGDNVANLWLLSEAAVTSLSLSERQKIPRYSQVLVNVVQIVNLGVKIPNHVLPCPWPPDRRHWKGKAPCIQGLTAIPWKNSQTLNKPSISPFSPIY